MKRLYEYIIEDHFTNYEQAIFLCGPRQVGKTTIAKNLRKSHPHSVYWNWDNINDRDRILSGPNQIAQVLPVDAVLHPKPLLIFDEIHKYRDWKTLIKGTIDAYKESLNILVTGSAKLDIFRKGGDSLMGRYFLYHIHPLSVAELIPSQQTTIQTDHPCRFPQELPRDVFENLYNLGGFPEPFLKGEKLYYNRWQRLRQKQFFGEDLPSVAQIQEIALMEMLAHLLRHQSGQLVNYTNLASKIRVSDQTIRRWITTLEANYYCFTIQPWSTNINRSLLKDPKVYLWDWSLVGENNSNTKEGQKQNGQRIENFVACHLLKAIHFWNDMGYGNFNLCFLRDKDQREVDFVVIKDGRPWILLEVKASLQDSLSSHLHHFQNQIKAPHVLQVAFNAPYVNVDCFSLNSPKIVPLITFLSQLV